ncbi:MAG: ATP-binding cassette domain-containing protein, partial [Elusimicrobiota bacterium]
MNSLQPELSSILTARRLDADYGTTRAVRDVTIDFYDRKITAIIGPSGCGKSTLIRCCNRMHEEIPGATVTGAVALAGRDIFLLDPVLLRRQVGMVFQRPNPFPSMSIARNVAAGVVLSGTGGADLDEVVEVSLKQAALWEEVKDKLRKPATDLSGGQQQRLCIARALAVKPQVLLLDEPCS